MCQHGRLVALAQTITSVFVAQRKSAGFRNQRSQVRILLGTRRDGCHPWPGCWLRAATLGSRLGKTPRWRFPFHALPL